MTADLTQPRAALVEALTEKANYLRRRSELPTEARRTDAELGYEAELDAAVSGLLTRAAEALREATITVPDEGVVEWAAMRERDSMSFNARLVDTNVVRTPDDWPIGSKVRVTLLPEEGQR